MTWELPAECEEAFRSALKRPLLADSMALGKAPAYLMDRTAVETLLPHRAPFVFIDRVTALDLEKGLIGACYDLSGSQEVLAGHFPGRPVWPGVLQVEAIAEAGIILYLLAQQAERGQRAEGRNGPAKVSMTHIAAARFVRPVLPGGDVEIAGRVFDDGFFCTVVGQCLRDGEICSVAAVNILAD